MYHGCSDILWCFFLAILECKNVELGAYHGLVVLSSRTGVVCWSGFEAKIWYWYRDSVMCE